MRDWGFMGHSRMVMQVLVAQERMASNFVYVFKKAQPSKFSWVAEVRQGLGFMDVGLLLEA